MCVCVGGGGGQGRRGEGVIFKNQKLPVFTEVGTLIKGQMNNNVLSL